MNVHVHVSSLHFSLSPLVLVPQTGTPVSMRRRFLSCARCRVQLWPASSGTPASSSTPPPSQGEPSAALVSCPPPLSLSLSLLRDITFHFTLLFSFTLYLSLSPFTSYQKWCQEDSAGCVPLRVHTASRGLHQQTTPTLLFRTSTKYFFLLHFCHLGVQIV